MATAQKSKTEKPRQHPKMTNRIAKKWLPRHHVAYLLKHKYYRILMLTGIVLICLIVAGQLLYPQDRGLPFASVNGRSLALATYEEMAKAITDQFDKSKLKLTIGSGKSIEYSVKLAGAEPNTEVMVNSLSEYPLWQRFIPGSILWPSAGVSVADVYYASKPFNAFAEARSKDFTFSPQNARLAIKEGSIIATDAVDGSEVNKDELLSIISRTPILLGQTITIHVPTKRLQADRSSKDLANVRGEAEAALTHEVIIKADDKQFSPDKTELASWVVLSTNDKGETILSIDKEKIKAYLREMNNQVGRAPGQTNITIVDGRETGRTTGPLGRAINVDTVTERLASGLLVPPQTINIAADFMEIQPSVIFNSKYTTTQAGLQAYIDDRTRTKSMHISIQQLNGGMWSASARATQSTPSGSTYKLFVALVLFDKINKGEIHWGDPMLDTTVAGCFERMTVASTNPCAEKWIAEFGRQYINDFIYARGFSHSTTFTASDATRTTAADLTKFMIGLNDGTLVGGANRDRLLDSLARHPYRYGIPTGSRGVVHDKVGFLWDYVHDTAIVQHPRGTYIMTIMTKGQSYGAIAALTREVERIMYP